MIRGPDSGSCPIRKELIFPGKSEINFEKDCKIFFHFKVLKPDETVIEDSRSYKRHMELCIGRKFRLACWEDCLKTMLFGEVAKFTVNSQLLAEYPIAACQMRQYLNGKTITRFGCCYYDACKKLPYPDLEELNKNPSDLIFIFEIIKVLRPGEYDKDYYFMTDEDKSMSLPNLRSKGNALYAEKKYNDALTVYSEAVVYLDDLLVKECPQTAEWMAIQEKRIPFLLNQGQCQLMLNDNYAAKQTFSEVLTIDGTNVKALYRRAKASRNLWNLNEALEDLKNVLIYDSSLEKLVASEICTIEQMRKEKRDSDKRIYSKMINH